MRIWIVSLTGALDDLDRLVRVLEEMTRAIRAVARQKLRRRDPSCFQLLLDPELLGWNC